MAPLAIGKDAVARTACAGEYARHRPEQTLLYQLVEAHYPVFVGHLAARERTLPAHVQREFGRSRASCARGISASMHVKTISSAAGWSTDS